MALGTPPAATPPASPSPLSGAYARLAEVYPALRVGEAAPAPRGDDGRLTTAELAAGGPALEAFLAWDAAQILREYGRPARPDVVASFALHRYTWPACLLFTIPWLLDRRVPRLPVPAVAFPRDLSRMTVRARSFACLPDDPAAALPGARVVHGEEALRAEVRAAVAEHLTPVLDAFRPHVRRGPRALWGMATDEIVEGLWYVGHLLGQEPRAKAAARRLLPGATTPYVGGAAFRELAGPDGRALVTRDRASCCMFYTLRPEDTCVTCPRMGDAERVERLAAGG